MHEDDLAEGSPLLRETSPYDWHYLELWFFVAPVPTWMWYASPHAMDKFFAAVLYAFVTVACVGAMLLEKSISDSHSTRIKRR